MSFNVRLTGYRGLIQTKVILPRQDSTDSVYLLNQPYEFSLVAASNGGSPVTLGPSGFPAWMDYANLVLVEVPIGSSIAYEVNTPNRHLLAASPASPTMFGIQRFNWGPGYTFSFIEAGTIPAGIELVSESGPFLTSESGTQLITP